MAGACGKSSGTALSGVPKPAKDAAIAAELPSSIRDRGSWTVASDVEYAPMEVLAADNKTPEGADIDLAIAVGDVLGLKTKIVNVVFSAIIPGLKSGKYDHEQTRPGEESGSSERGRSRWQETGDKASVGGGPDDQRREQRTQPT